MQIVHDNKIWESREDDYFEYWEPVEAEVTPPKPKWKLAKIPLVVWYKFLKFSKDSYEKHKAESMVFLYYCEKKNTWDIWAPPQETQGMTVNVTEGDEFEKQRKEMPPMFFGTGHHHCIASAFQSGTDHDDELEKEGVHFTLGHMDKEVYDIHCRMVIDKICYEIHPAEIVDLPACISAIPFEDLRLEAGLRILSTPVTRVTYPKQWMDNITKKTWTRSYNSPKTDPRQGTLVPLDDWDDYNETPTPWWERGEVLPVDLKSLTATSCLKAIRDGKDDVIEALDDLTNEVCRELSCDNEVDLLFIMNSEARDSHTLKKQEAIREAFRPITVVKGKVIEILSKYHLYYA